MQQALTNPLCSEGKTKTLNLAGTHIVSLSFTLFYKVTGIIGTKIKRGKKSTKGRGGQEISQYIGSHRECNRQGNVLISG